MLVSVWFPLVHDHVGETLGDLHRMRILKRKKRKVNPRKHNLNPHHWVMFLCLLMFLFRVHRVLQVTTHPYGTRFWTTRFPCKGNWTLWTVIKKKLIIANVRWSTSWTSTSFTPASRCSLHRPLLRMIRGVLSYPYPYIIFKFIEDNACF